MGGWRNGCRRRREKEEEEALINPNLVDGSGSACSSPVQHSGPQRYTNTATDKLRLYAVQNRASNKPWPQHCHKSIIIIINAKDIYKQYLVSPLLMLTFQTLKSLGLALVDLSWKLKSCKLIAGDHDANRFQGNPSFWSTRSSISSSVCTHTSRLTMQPLHPVSLCSQPNTQHLARLNPFYLSCCCRWNV